MKKVKFKHIALGIFLLIGTIIIISSIMLINALFFSKSLDGYSFTNNWSDFDYAYQHDLNSNDFPDGIQLVSSTCEISEDQKTFTYILKLKNVSKVDKKLQAQLFFDPKYISTYGSNTQNPFISFLNEFAFNIDDEEIQEIKYTSNIIGNGSDAVENFKENFTQVYLEADLGIGVSRAVIPVRFI